MKLVFADMPFIPRPIKVYFARQMIEDRKFLKKAMDDLILEPYPLEANIAKYPGPVLALWGDHDRIIDPGCATMLAAKAPRIQKALIKDCGHLPMLEKPEETASVYMDFLSSR
jgi:pimeloyl-ACP methyl ester carboxylesterase